MRKSHLLSTLVVLMTSVALAWAAPLQAPPAQDSLAQPSVEEAEAVPVVEEAVAAEAVVEEAVVEEAVVEPVVEPVAEPAMTAASLAEEEEEEELEDAVVRSEAAIQAQKEEAARLKAEAKAQKAEAKRLAKEQKKAEADARKAQKAQEKAAAEAAKAQEEIQRAQAEAEAARVAAEAEKARVDSQTQLQQFTQPQQQQTTPQTQVIVVPTAGYYPYPQSAAPAAETYAPVAAAAPVATKSSSPNFLQRFYDKNGKSYLSILSVGYTTFFLMPNNTLGAGGAALPTTEFTAKRHILNLEILEWRVGIFGMQMLNFEMGLNTPCTTASGTDLSLFMRGTGNVTTSGLYTDCGLAQATAKQMWFAYKPSIKFYVPVTSWLAVELYGGVEVDLTKMWSKIWASYYEGHTEYADQNYFFGAYGGAGLFFQPLRALPIEIKAEYRHPLQGNTMIVPQGFYLTAQIHLGARIRKD